MAASEAPVVELRNISFAYDEEVVLNNVSLDVCRHDFMGIIGPNGGGKTTLLNIMIGSIRPQEGTVRVFGKEPEHVRTRIGYVPQTSHYAMGIPVTVFDVVLMGRYGKRGLLRRFNREDEAAAEEALGRVGMERYRNRAFDHLSGGQRQRVIIARALVTNPELLLLDEPNVGVDSDAKTELFELLHHLNKTMTIVIVTHDLTAVSAHIGKIACVNKTLYYHGDKEIKKETIEQLYHCPVELIAHGVPHRVLEEH